MFLLRQIGVVDTKLQNKEENRMNRAMVKLGA